MEFRRKIYTRGGSMETTIPKPLLFETDEHKKYDLIFKFNKASKRWYVEVDERE